MAKQSFKTAVGAFVIGGLALLVAGIILLGGGRMFSDDIEYVLYFDGSVSGLNIGAPVVFRGVPMGQVTRISLEANPRDASVTIPVYIRLDENSIVRAGVTGELTDNFRQEILRRYFKCLCEQKITGTVKETERYKLELLMNQADLTVGQREVEKQAHARSESTGGAPAAAIELPDGTVVTGKTGPLLGAAASALMNALKVLAGIPQETDLVSAASIEPIQTLKTNYLGGKNPRLHTDEILIALSSSAASNEQAAAAMHQLPNLKGCDVHSTVLLSGVDTSTLNRLGMYLTCDPVYEEEDRKYHKQ